MGDDDRLNYSLVKGCMSHEALELQHYSIKTGLLLSKQFQLESYRMVNFRMKCKKEKINVLLNIL